MGIFLSLSGIALREVVGGALQKVGLGGGSDAVVGFLTERFTDHSQTLTKALQTANERAWKALEVALAGESFWERCKVRLASADDQAFGKQVRTFLDNSYLRQWGITQSAKCQQCLTELRRLRKDGGLTTGRLAPDELARQAGDFARFSDPHSVLEAEWRVIDRAAAEIQKADCRVLTKLLVARPPGGGASILAIGVRYFFRREVENDPQLSQGLAFAKLEAIHDAQEKGFAALNEALSKQGQRLESMLSEVLAVVTGIDSTTTDTNVRVRGLEEQIQRLLERLQLQGRELRPSDSMSIRTEGERQLVKQLVTEYRSLPEEKRRQLPGLLSNLGKLELAAGDFGEAQQKFQTVANMVSDPKAQAEAHHNAYQAALERQQWAEALASLRQAVALDPARFAPFPDRYEPTSILGAGGFGVAFLCHHKFMKANIVVKTLQSDELDCDVDHVFTEAHALRQLDHPSIVRLSDCGYADAGGKSRPYLAMDYFEGRNLESYVAEQGLLSPKDLLAAAIPVAEALQAAHARRILHRDVKPANILVRRDASGWRVKLIDFGLALRPETLEGKASTQARTTIGRSIAGTLHYAAPEQMGQLPGVAVGSYSDVYGFGKTCYYALLATSEPDDVERDGLPEPWRKFLARCTGRLLANRLPDFAAVLAGLAEVRQQTAVQVVTAATQPESDWSAALTNVTNPALVAFYKKELAAGQENYLRERSLRYRIAGKRRWFIAARRRSAYVWQHGRFDGDIDFWRSGLNQPDQVKAVKDGACLSFSLSTDQDFQFFRQAATEKLLAAKWTETASDDEPDGEVEGGFPVGVRPLYLKSKGIVATGYETQDDFVVLAGSQAVKETVPSIPGGVVEMRNRMIQQGALVAGTDCLILEKDFPFESASMAAGVMLGRSANGRIEWKDTDGRTLKEIQNAAHVEPVKAAKPPGVRKELTLRVLQRRGLLHTGTEIEVMPDAMPNDGVKRDQAIFRARIGSLDSQKSVVWIHDGNAYSLTELSVKLEQHGLSWIIPKTFELRRISGQTESMWVQADKLRSPGQSGGDGTDESAEGGGGGQSEDGGGAGPVSGESEAVEGASDCERYSLRLKFWGSLLNRPNAKATRHANNKPGKYSWIAAGSGVKGLPFQYVIGQHEGRVELFIDRGADAGKEGSKGIFDTLHSHKAEIEQSFGGVLSWERLEDKRACRIAFTTTAGGWRSDEAKWPAIQDAMIDAMIRLEQALTPHLEKLKTELAS